MLCSYIETNTPLVPTARWRVMLEQSALDDAGVLQLVVCSSCGVNALLTNGREMSVQYHVIYIIWYYNVSRSRLEHTVCYHTCRLVST